ncbi:MAG: HD domain-containing protein [Candidatus Moranbacteria bacterium]|nr:HD domain-containing protein [Candidatus Moranbacteria bacterium]
MFEYLRLLSVLSRYRTKEQFFGYLDRWAPFTLKEKETIRITFERMEKQFSGVRRESGGPYIGHLLAVATILMIHLEVTDANEILAALLHDVTEHFPKEWPSSRILKEYGSEVAYLVDIMTKPSGRDDETDEEREVRIDTYHDRFKIAKKAAVRLKMCDWMHNILTLIYCAPEKQKRKWLEALRYALPRALEHRVLYGELWTALHSPVLFVIPSIPGPTPKILTFC